jgi:hypothetical protein
MRFTHMPFVFDFKGKSFLAGCSCEGTQTIDLVGVESFDLYPWKLFLKDLESDQIVCFSEMPFVVECSPIYMDGYLSFAAGENQEDDISYGIYQIPLTDFIQQKTENIVRRLDAKVGFYFPGTYAKVVKHKNFFINDVLYASPYRFIYRIAPVQENIYLITGMREGTYETVVFDADKGHASLAILNEERVDVYKSCIYKNELFYTMKLPAKTGSVIQRTTRFHYKPVDITFTKLC